MHIVDWVTNLGSRFAPVDGGVIKTLQIQLIEEYNKTIENYRKKMEKNNNIKFEMDSLENQKKNADFDGNQDVASDITYRLKELNKEIQAPTILEKACMFFDKPIVKLFLLLSFGLVSAFIAKRILGKKKEEDEKDLETEENNLTSNYPPPYHYPPFPYQPYGSNPRRF